MKACLFPNRDFNLASTAAPKTPAPKVLGCGPIRAALVAGVHAHTPSLADCVPTGGQILHQVLPSEGGTTRLVYLMSSTGPRVVKPLARGHTAIRSWALPPDRPQLGFSALSSRHAPHPFRGPLELDGNQASPLHPHHGWTFQ